MHESPIREPLIVGNPSYTDITHDICVPTETRPSKYWLAGFAVSVLVMMYGFFCIGYTVTYGIGTWGVNKTIGWAWDITNFVWWIGIGHAGTLISAILLIFRQEWRNSINRSAEAMTIFAVLCAALFPIIHMGRPWNAFWVLPLPNDLGPLWPNFNSALLWDVFAISTYLTVSVLFWYTGLIPDLATLRDRSKSKLRKNIFSFFSFGWTGSMRHWNRFELVSLILAGVSTPLVLSVHTIVSFDFATSIIPGWHTTIFPPYFVAGAIFSGFAMVLTLMIIARKVMGLEKYITVAHLEAMAKIITLTGSMVGLAYATEFFMAWYGQNDYEGFAFINRAFGPYWWAYWSMITCNVVSPQFFWFGKLRRNINFIWCLTIFVNIGMWFERFVIIVTSLHRDFLPSSWAMYSPTWVEMGIYIGTFGLFFTLFLLFAKYLPVIAIAEVKLILKATLTSKPKEAIYGYQDQNYDIHKAYAITQAAKIAVTQNDDHSQNDDHHDDERNAATDDNANPEILGKPVL
ncbi:MAG: NrfD/PsrC family molybdoenzyme membrane anchor subunit [Bacteroidota bacterium]|nr:NrfD/PsrC family molybdoenzyme membrane anchor subunit [Bacteroidota bacterium]